MVCTGIGSSCNFSSNAEVQLVTSLLPDPNMELLNFTASPAYCPAVDARAQWEIVRRAYAHMSARQH